MFFIRSILMVAIVIALAACQTTGVAAPNEGYSTLTTGAVPHAANMGEGARTNPPIGYIAFCLRNREECNQKGPEAPAPVALGTNEWLELNRINDYVNKTVRPVTDQQLVQKAEWWSYPINGAGDCEDYVLEKRRQLIAAGWPADALLITVVRQWNGEGHAVLSVVTDKGDLILDNLKAGIVSWEKAPYTWVMRQSRSHPYVWVKLDGAATAGAQRTASAPVSSVANGPSGL